MNDDTPLMPVFCLRFNTLIGYLPAPVHAGVVPPRLPAIVRRQVGDDPRDTVNLHIDKLELCTLPSAEPMLVPRYRVSVHEQDMLAQLPGYRRALVVPA